MTASNVLKPWQSYTWCVVWPWFWNATIGYMMREAQLFGVLVETSNVACSKSRNLSTNCYYTASCYFPTLQM